MYTCQLRKRIWIVELYQTLWVVDKFPKHITRFNNRSKIHTTYICKYHVHASQCELEWMERNKSKRHSYGFYSMSPCRYAWREGEKRKTTNFINAFVTSIIYFYFELKANDLFAWYERAINAFFFFCVFLESSTTNVGIILAIWTKFRSGDLRWRLYTHVYRDDFPYARVRRNVSRELW